jgi:diguanylate cyclase (GGDEF)-like protein
MDQNTLLSRVTRYYDSVIPHKDAGLVARDQINSYYKHVRSNAVGNIFNAVAVAVTFWTALPAAVIITWIGALVFVMGWNMHRRRDARRRGDSIDPAYELHRNIWGALATGSLWGIATAVFAVYATPVHMVVLGIVSAGMMNAGMLTLYTTPRLALAFLTPLAIGNTIAFIAFGAIVGIGYGVVLTALSLSYTAILYRSIGTSFAAYVAQLVAKFHAEESRETVKLLLNDYEEQGADWLWDVDLDGNLGIVSENFATAAGRPVEILSHTPLITLFVASPETEILRDAIAKHTPFRDLTVSLEIGGETRWWTISARARTQDGHIAGLRGVATDVTIARAAETKVAYMAHYDGLTDLPNRALFNETFARALKRQGMRNNTAIWYLDLDNFKSVNDTLGHPVGDQLLKVIARRLEACVDAHDMIARLGGDEFAILRSDVADAAEASKLAEKILAAVSEPITIDGHNIMASTSIGIAMAPSDGDSANELIKKADLALYSSKDGGRNRFSFFEAGMDLAARERREIEMDIRSALGKDELSLHYQPLIDIETGATVGYEALMRWQHPERGAIMPDDFIPIAEETGLIVQLGEWVIREAIAEVARWPEHLSVSINLSPGQMRSAGLISTIVNALAANNVTPERVELEITETVLMQDSDVNLAILHRFRDIGLRVSLDDFGTGYSSLNYLRSFPFDKIKIDRCFIEGVDTRTDCRAIIQSVIHLAKSLGMTTTAEGVESNAQLAQLNIEGCTHAQGYLFSKAIPAAELTDLRSPAPHYPPNAVTPLLPALDLPEQIARPKRSSMA